LVNSSLKGQNDTQILIANTALEFSEKVNLLLLDESRRRAIGKNARVFVKESYSWKQTTDKLETVLMQTSSI